MWLEIHADKQGSGKNIRKFDINYVTLFKMNELLKLEEKIAYLSLQRVEAEKPRFITVANS